MSIEMISGKFNLSIDGQFGSTGKGLLNSVLARWNAPEICVSNAAPNAGHTYDLNDGKGKRTVFHLPVTGVLNKDSVIYLCAGSIVDVALLGAELHEFEVDPSRVIVHPRACILIPALHGAREKELNSGATGLASTQKGVGAALADKVARIPGPRVAEQCEELRGLGVVIKNLDLTVLMDQGKCVFMEVPQGFSLSINHGLSYPHCTSRDITVAAAMNDAGVHPSYLGKVYMSLRTFPIRVGNIVKDGEQLGYSGDFYHDSVEKTWEEMGQEPELTTVTKRVRRIATFSEEQYLQALIHNRPDVVFVNFWNYIEGRSQEEKDELLARMAQAETRAKLKPYRIYGMGHTVDDVRGGFTYREGQVYNVG